METEPYHSVLISGFILNDSWLSTSNVLAIVLLIVLLLISAFVSGSEVAFFSLTPTEKDKLESSHDLSAKSVIKLLETPNRLLATILIANNFVNVAIVVLSTYITSMTFDFSQTPRLGFIFQLVVVTFLILLFGEIIPKIYASGNALRLSRVLSRGMLPLISFFWPFSSMLLFINRRVKKYVVRNTKAISMRDLSHMLELTEGEISEDKEILEGIVKFGKIYVSEVYQPRMDIVALNINTPFNEVLDVVTSSGYSRIPVYSKSLDDIRGILYVKDLLPHLNQPSTFRWQTLLRPGYYVPESKRISELLKEFQFNKIHMALVIDEYGGIQGLVTLEDILEEIVGEIVDEFDEESPLFKQLSDDEFIFEAKISLIDFYKIANLPDNVLDDAKGEADTLAGFILELIGEIPDKNLKISHKNILFEVMEVDDKRIKKIKVKIDRIFEKKGEG